MSGSDIVTEVMVGLLEAERLAAVDQGQRDRVEVGADNLDSVPSGVVTESFAGSAWRNCWFCFSCFSPFDGNSTSLFDATPPPKCLDWAIAPLFLSQSPAWPQEFGQED
jgi:hypothetical protein